MNGKGWSGFGEAKATLGTFYAHLSLAIAADGTRRPLGVAALKHWTRNAAVKGVEFQRWEDQVRESSAQLDGLKNAIHLMDREADDHQMFSAFLRDGHRFVARCVSDRRIETSMGTTKLRELLATIPTTVEREISLQRSKQHRNPIMKKIHPARESRTARLSVAAATVLLKRPFDGQQTAPCPAIHAAHQHRAHLGGRAS